MTDLSEFQFELGEVVFGRGCPIKIADGGWDLGAGEWRTQDAPLPNESAVLFGRDYKNPPAWTFELFADTRSMSGALVEVSRLEAVWNNDSTSRTPGRVVPLRYHIDGRTRVIFGRPRRWATAAITNRLRDGYLPITADFQRADTRYYAEYEDSLTMDLVPASTGGLEAPLSAPLSTVMSGGEREGQFRVGGDTSTWVSVTFHGPITDPSVTVDGWTLALVGTLAYDQAVTVDPRPWQRSAVRNDGASVGGLISPNSRLDEMVVAPGFHEAVFNGIDPTNTGSVTLTWRDAYTSV